MAMELLSRQQGNRTDNHQSLSEHAGATRNVSAMLLGSRLLNKMLTIRNISLSGIPQELLTLLMGKCGIRTPEDLYEHVGTGKLPASTVVRYLLEILQDDQPRGA